jgi:LacI family transcriptional regulator
MGDVAQQAGVSVKTVSRVVNDDPAVAPGTAERVRREIARLGYAPHGPARSLRSGRALRLGLILHALTDPFFAAMYDGVAAVAWQHGHLLLAGASHADLDDETQAVRALLSHGVDALIAAPLADSAPDIWRGVGVPLVLVGRQLPGLEADSVLADDEGGLRSALAHLAGLGHRVIGYLDDGEATWTSSVRREAFFASLASLGLPRGPVATVSGQRGVGGAAVELELRDTLATWMSSPGVGSGSLAGSGSGGTPTGPVGPVSAIVAGSARASVALLRVLAGGELARPAVVGVEDLALADLLTPALTVVTQQPEAIGRAAAALAFRRMSDPHAPPQAPLIGTQLIVRSSTFPVTEAWPSGGAAPAPPPGADHDPMTHHTEKGRP